MLAKCCCNFLLTTGTADQSKKGGALNHIYSVLALVHTTHTQDNAKVGIKKAMTKLFVRDPFNPEYVFSQDPTKYIEEESIICITTSYKNNEDVLGLKEEEVILIQDKIQQTSEVLTLQYRTNRNIC